MTFSSSSMTASPQHIPPLWSADSAQCRSLCSTVSWLADPSETVQQLLGAGRPWVETFCSSRS